MGDLWGVAPRDLNRKTPRELITRLITSVALDGNMLLNIGPNADGSVQSWQADIMARIGDWMKVHGEAIYGCVGERQAPFSNNLAPWRTTKKGETLYLHLLRYPGPSFGVANIHDYWLESARILDTAQRLRIVHEPARDLIVGLPAVPPDDIATVIEIKVREKTEVERKEAGNNRCGRSGLIRVHNLDRAGQLRDRSRRTAVSCAYEILGFPHAPSSSTGPQNCPCVDWASHGVTNCPRCIAM